MFITFFKTQSLRRSITYIFVIDTLAALNGSYEIRTYSYRIISTFGLSELANQLASISFTLASLLMMLVVIWLVDKFTRLQQTYLTIVSAIIVNLLMFILGLVENTLAVKICIIVIMFVSIMTYDFGIGAFLFILSGEVLPIEYKALGQTLQSCFLFALVAVNNYWFPPVFEKIGSYTFLVHVTVNVLGLVYVFLYAVYPPLDFL